MGHLGRRVLRPASTPVPTLCSRPAEMLHPLQEESPHSHTRTHTHTCKLVPFPIESCPLNSAPMWTREGQAVRSQLRRGGVSLQGPISVPPVEDGPGSDETSAVRARGSPEVPQVSRVLEREAG